MANWTLRRANLRDAEPLTSCFQAAYSLFAVRIADLPQVSSGIAEEIAENQVWVAELPAGIVGGLVLVSEPGFMHLANVAVHPAHSGTGLGRALIALAVAEASKQGYNEISLTTHAEMLETIEFYKHFGWEETGREGNKVSMKLAL